MNQTVTKAHITNPDQWLQGLFTAIDSKDTDQFLDHLRNDASFRFGSAPGAEGREQIEAAVNTFFDSIQSSQHTVAQLWPAENSLVCEGTVTYVRHDDSTMSLPFANVYKFIDGKISEYRIYIDIAPLYANSAG